MDYTLDDYLAGGTVYLAIQAKYGTDAADNIASIAYANGNAIAAGDPTSVNTALSKLARTTPANAANPVVVNATPDASAADTSTADNFIQQITTNPLAAPLDGLNNQLKKAFGDVFKNPFVLLAVVAVIFWFIGGFGWAKGRLNK